MKKFFISTSVLSTIIVFCIFFLSPGSAETLRTLAASDKNTVVIDAGHGGYDSGGVSQDDAYEKNITLAISLKVGSLLQQQNIDVVYTRDSDAVSWLSDNKKDLQARVDIANAYDADYFVSIHTNSSDNFNDGAYGFEFYYDGSNTIIENTLQQLSSALTSLDYTQDRGIKENDELYVIKHNSCATMLLELGFLSDSDDAAYLVSDDGQNNIAQAIASSIIDNI